MLLAMWGQIFCFGRDFNTDQSPIRLVVALPYNQGRSNENKIQNSGNRTGEMKKVA
jgi:hypothetical protein